jgi:hypothetical protein
MTRTTRIGLGIAAVLLAIQLIRPERNYSNDQTKHFKTQRNMPDSIETLLRNGCYDCHSNYTTYTPYINIQPVGWWMASHVRNGKKALNISEFAALPADVQRHKFEEIIEVVESGDMPLQSYMWFNLHPQAEYTSAQRKAVADWARTQLSN